jgi:hypothetical protein
MILVERSFSPGAVPVVVFTGAREIWFNVFYVEDAECMDDKEFIPVDFFAC